MHTKEEFETDMQRKHILCFRENKNWIQSLHKIIEYNVYIVLISLRYWLTVFDKVIFA